MHFPERIYGIENEFGVIGEYASGERTDKLYDDVTGIGYITLNPIEHSVIATYPQPRIWHSNGSCTYLDAGWHPEHATAECRSIRDVVRFNKAGEMLAAQLFERKPGHELKFLLFKNNQGFDEYGNFCGEFGCHENYLFYGSASHEPCNSYPTIDFRSMIPFLITRQIFDGAGWWDRSGDLHLSQRARVIMHEFGHSSTGNRPIIQIKTSDTGSNMRLHLILGDANILEFAMYLKIGTTALVLALLEANCCPNVLCTNAIDALQSIASMADPYTPRVKMANGNIYSALEMQYSFLNTVKRELPAATFASADIEQEVRHIAQTWEQALNAIKNRDEKWMLGRFDYATKKYLIERELARRGITDKAEMFLLRKNFDILYHGVSDRTLQQRMNKLWTSRRIVSNAQISDAMLNPPSNTRARMRGMFVHNFTNHGKRAIPFVDWIGFGDNQAAPEDRKLLLDDPFVFNMPGFDAFLSQYIDNIVQ